MDNATHTLVADDGPEICLLLERYLRSQGFRVSVANDGAAMEKCLATANPSPVVLDASGLELGADDYLCKPFNPRELIARIRTVHRHVEARGNREKPSRYAFRFEDFVADPETSRVVTADGTEIASTATEFSLLMAFLERPRKMLSRNHLLEIAQARDAVPFDRFTDVLVSRLRRKLNDADKRQLLKTRRNGGYQSAARVDYAEPLK